MRDLGTRAVRTALTVVVAAALTVPAIAQAGPASNALQAFEDQTNTRLNALEARVTALEVLTSQPTPTPVPSATPSPTPQPTSSPTPSPSPTPSSSPSPSPTASPSPSPTPTAVPTPTPTPVPTATPSPTATPTPSGGTPTFGTRPNSGALSYNGNCPSIIENKYFHDLGANVIAIRIENCSNVTIRNVDFKNVAEGVYAINSNNISILDSRAQNILGPHERDGSNRANFSQYNNVNGGTIARNKSKCGDTEDVISLFATSNVIVENNHIEGFLTSTTGCLAWSSGSGTGIISGDGNGNNNIIRNNIVVNPGQVGIAIAGGSNNKLQNNIIIGDKRPGANNGLYVNNYSEGTCSNNSVTGNRANFKNESGQSNSGWMGDGSCSGTTESGNNWDDSTLSSANYHVSL